MRRDDSGMFWETVFDVVSLAFSVADVIDNPDDIWAWVGLVCDVVDLIPFVSCMGEAAKALRVTDTVLDAADSLNDTRKASERTLEAIKTAAKNLKEGDHFVYIAKGSDGIIEYVGITNDFVRRKAEWAAKGRQIELYIDSLDRNSVRIVEQTVIETFGMAKNGGRLTNKINSISTKNPLYEAVKSFKKLIK
jgi:predicted GIY-YIG superfamily endonuclease